jgi:hypothetical protein
MDLRQRCRIVLALVFAACSVPVSPLSSSVDSGATTTSSGGGTCDPQKEMDAHCNSVCADLYGCGLAKNPATAQQYCPGFTSAKQDVFLHGNGPASCGCVPTCVDQAPFASYVDKNDCKKTIEFFKTNDGTFASICQNGP